jgi:CHAT domain-containing protein
MMVVVQPNTPGYTRLEYTTHELQKIEDRVPKECLLKLGIPGSPALSKTVLSSLQATSIAHFACHGEQSVVNPLESALILEDGRLKVSEIMQQSISDGSLAFLSACQTAMGDGKLPDEAIHLAATLLFAGFQGVVATMW